MGKGRKIEDWFDRRIAQTRELDKLPGEISKSVSTKIQPYHSRTISYPWRNHGLSPVTETVSYGVDQVQGIVQRLLGGSNGQDSGEPESQQSIISTHQ